MCYGPLLHGCTTVLYEGKPGVYFLFVSPIIIAIILFMALRVPVGTPDPGAFPRVIEEHKVSALFCAPTALRAIKKEDPQGEHIRKHNLSSLRTLFLAGERSDPPTVAWAEKQFGVPVIDNYWQTETGSPMCINPVGFSEGRANVPAGSAGLPVPGWNMAVLRNDGQPAAPNELGDVVAKLPLPPGALSTLWQRDALFLEKYLQRFPGVPDAAMGHL